MNIIWDGVEIFGNEILLTSEKFPNERVTIARSSMVCLEYSNEKGTVLKTRFSEYNLSDAAASDVGRLLHVRNEDDYKALQAAIFLRDYCASRNHCAGCSFLDYMDCILADEVRPCYWSIPKEEDLCSEN